jgi:O-succinylbenzoic acid--CoA ligase
MVLEDFLTEWNNDNARIIVHTSGSTGKPKPMWVEKQRMKNSARITCDFLGLKEGDTALLCMSLDYIAGKMVVVRSLECGLHLISVNPGGHPLSADSLGSYKGEITFAAMVPLQVYNSLHVPAERLRLKAIRHLIIGGGFIDNTLAQELKSFPNYVWSTYGMTETLSHIALRRLNGEGATLWYTPFESVHVSLNQEGCLVIDAPMICDHILVTNDCAELSPDGRRFRILGRKDNVIDSGGIKIQIEEVEQMLKPFLRVPYIITKCSDVKFGEVVVLLTEDNEMSDVQEICMNALPKYWQPRRYFHIDHLPMTITNKPARGRAQEVATLCETERLGKK